VHSTLGALAIDDEPRARLRETARVFLSAGGSFTAAAEQLTLHKNTVHYRVRKAEEIIGRPLQESRLDIELALSACRWLGPAILQPPSS
jgi:DNA-binding PucR family transcriptional regulator